MPGAVVWRIARRPHARDRTGAGARLHGGRWNRPGTAVVYAGASVAIAALETLVHSAGATPPDLVLVRIELPAGGSREAPRIADLPAGWDAVPPRPASIDLGTRWAREARSLALYVPSALLPEERNVLLNPRHPEFDAVTMTIARPFRFDSRVYLPRRPP